MTDWKKVQGSQEEKPQELDTSSSPTTVYQRRNIERVSVEQEDGTTTMMWEYEERKMSREEYAVIVSGQIDQIRADIDYISAVAEIEL